MSGCIGCKYAIIDYFEYYGGVKQYFAADCEKDMPGEAECEEFEESEDKLDGDPIDIDKTVEHYEGTLEVLKGVGLEDDE